MKDTCPTRDILVQFVNATFTDTEADKIVAHLDSCESCCRTVDELERTQPALVALDRLRDIDGLNEIESPLPKKIGQYEIIEQIGQGGMGVVYRAVHPHLKREVALKIIRDSRLDDPTARERFVQEMQSLGKLSHPNIVLATDARIDGDTPFIVTELLDGHDLGTWIAAHGKMPIKQAVDCIRQAATGLAYAHEKGYVHRDIKPSNLFLTHDGVIKILDLGIARPPETGPGNGQTVTGHIVGSPEFMAPEQFHDGTVDARSDIYSLGRTFAYILNENVPTRLKRVLIQMTTGLPDQRYQSADELIRALDAATKSPKLLFCTAMVAVVISVATFFMLPSSTSVPDPVIPPVPTTETKADAETPKTGEQKSTAKEADFAPRHFDITNPVGWDGFFEDVVNDYWINRAYHSWDRSFTFFRFLHQLGRDSDADRLVSLRLSRSLPGDEFSQTEQRIADMNVVANWENALGNKEKSDEYHARIEEMIAAETSDLKRDQLEYYYENRKKYDRIREASTVPREFRNAILHGDPSIKDLCDQGRYREAVEQYLTILRSSDELLDPQIGSIYNGYGVVYVVSRMVEKGDLDGAEKLREEAPHSPSMDFQMANSLALGYLKAGRKSEAQATWDNSMEKLTETINAGRAFYSFQFLNALLESLHDSGLYEYVRNESGK